MAVDLSFPLAILYEDLSEPAAHRDECADRIHDDSGSRRLTDALGAPRIFPLLGKLMYWRPGS
jgi:hypothetical protein